MGRVPTLVESVATVSSSSEVGCKAHVRTLPFMTVFFTFCTLEWLLAALMAFVAALCV
jgi:hypothetical protein